MAKSQAVGKVEATHGSIVVTDHTARNIRLYSVYEPELRLLTFFNSITVSATATGTGFASFLASQVMDNLRGPEAQFQDAIDGVCVICAVVSIVFFGFAIWAWRGRQSEFARIINNSRLR